MNKQEHHAERRGYICKSCEQFYGTKEAAKKCQCDEKIEAVVICKCGSLWIGSTKVCYSCGERLHRAEVEAIRAKQNDQ